MVRAFLIISFFLLWPETMLVGKHFSFSLYTGGVSNLLCCISAADVLLLFSS